MEVGDVGLPGPGVTVVVGVGLPGPPVVGVVTVVVVVVGLPWFIGGVGVGLLMVGVGVTGSSLPGQ